MATTTQASGMLRIGVGLALAGALAALLDLLFASCIATGPCQPVPPMPIVIPVLVIVIGAVLVPTALWQRRAQTR